VDCSLIFVLSFNFEFVYRAARAGAEDINR
jgi:hypothetical protein